MIYFINRWLSFFPDESTSRRLALSESGLRLFLAQSLVFITERKRMEEALRAKDDLKEAILVVRRVYKS